MSDSKSAVLLKQLIREIVSTHDDQSHHERVCEDSVDEMSGGVAGAAPYSDLDDKVIEIED